MTDLELPVLERELQWLTRVIDLRISRLAFGDSTAKRREVSEDNQLVKALELLHKGQSQRDLFALVSSTAPLPPAKR